jgi:HD-GYP domain-containing protein (c-di-GMP phosphodiesterase class II)
MDNNYFHAQPTLYDKYIKTRLYYKDSSNRFFLYKDTGTTLSQMRIDTSKIPDLYISEHDKLESVMEMQSVLNKQIKEEIVSGEITSVKNTLVSLMTETLSEPRSGSLRGVSETIDILIDGYSKQPNFFSTLSTISTNDYSTAIHSINVCAMTLGICFKIGYNDHEIKEMGLAAMLHDTGKINVPNRILNAPRRLNSDEFGKIKQHPFNGYKFLKEAGFEDKTCQVAYQHHERLNGEGYPKGLKSNSINKTSQLVGLIDFYEAITNHDRAYRRADAPIDAFSIIKICVDKGELDSYFFETMVQYLFADT